MRTQQYFSLALLSLLSLVISSCAALNPEKNKYSTRYVITDDLARIQNQGSIRIGIKRHAPPFSQRNKNNTLVGFDVDIAKAVAVEMGVKLELVPLDSKDRIPFLESKTVDAVIATMTTTRKREEKIDFTIPYFEDGQGLLCKKDSSISSYKDLKNKNVGAAAGTTSFSNMKQVQPECEMIAFKNYKEGVDALLAGKISAFTGDYLVLKGLKHHNAQSSSLEVRGNRFTVEPYGIAIRENQSNFKDRLEQALVAIWKNEAWQSIHEKWLGEDSVYSSNDQFVMQKTE